MSGVWDARTHAEVSLYYAAVGSRSGPLFGNRDQASVHNLSLLGFVSLLSQVAVKLLEELFDRSLLGELLPK